MASPKAVAVTLVPIDSKGNPQPLVAPLELYLSHPVVQVTKFEIKNLRLEGAKGEEQAYCDLEIAGTVTSAFAKTDGQKATIGKGDLFVNGDDEASYSFAVHGERDSEADVRRPYRASFSLTAPKLRVTDGNNVFELRIEDEVTGFFGESAWHAGFAFPWPLLEGEEPDPDAVKVPTITEAAAQHGGGSSGEAELYAVEIQGISPELAASAQLHLGVEKVISCRLKQSPAGQGYLAHGLEDDRLLLVALRVTDRKTGFEPNDKELVKILDASGIAKLSPRSAFLHSYSVGLLAGGADLVAGPKQQAIRAVEISKEKRAVILRSHLNLADGSVVDLQSPIWPAAAEVKPLPAGELKTSEILAYTMQLMRSADPRAKEFTLAMLTGDFTDMGWENVRAMDWREAFYSTVAETLEAGLEACDESSPQNAGYHMGRFVGEALRLTSDPQQPTRIGKSLKSEFLRQLIKARIFTGRVSAVQALIGKLMALFRR